MSQAGKNWSLIWISGGKKCVFLIKTALNRGIRAISFRKKNVLNQGPCWLKPCYQRIPCKYKYSSFGRVLNLIEITCLSSTKYVVNHIRNERWQTTIWTKTDKTQHCALWNLMICLNIHFFYLFRRVKQQPWSK